VKIDIENLTIGQVRELQALIGGNSAPKAENTLPYPIGKYVICRSSNEGVNAGILLAADETGCQLKDARRLRTHKPVIGAWYEGVSLTGLDYEESTTSAAAPEKFIIEDYSLTVCTDAAAESIKNAPAYEA